MSVLRARQLALVATLTIVATSLAAQQPAALDRAFADFWKADGGRASERAAERILQTGADFETIYARVRAGRPYGKQQTGEFAIRAAARAGALFDNRIDIPPDYTPDRPWPVRVQLHGGVSRPASATVGGASLEEEAATQGGRAPDLSRQRRDNRIRGENQIYIHPNGFAGSEWWHQHQVDNILRLVDTIKRRYNVDESRIYLTGISDGGTGVYYMAMKDPTVWSSFLPLNGSIKVLGNPAVRADGEMFAANLPNRPFYIVSGEKDHLYPAADVATHVQAFSRLGVTLVFRRQNAGHDTSWWPFERSQFENFVKQKRREAHPARVSWQTERVDRFNRADWLVIDELGMGTIDTDFEPLDLFEHRRPSGRVDVVREGNAFTAQTRGTLQFTLLLAPDAIDFARPVTVRVNRREVFNAVVRRDPAVLLKWAARDNDRTRLYGAEIKVTVP
jgi:poly(3-hydroxybutyrate) depolymerase